MDIIRSRHFSGSDTGLSTRDSLSHGHHSVMEDFDAMCKRYYVEQLKVEPLMRTGCHSSRFAPILAAREAHETDSL